MELFYGVYSNGDDHRKGYQIRAWSSDVCHSFNIVYWRQELAIFKITSKFTLFAGNFSTPDLCIVCTLYASYFGSLWFLWLAQREIGATNMSHDMQQYLLGLEWMLSMWLCAHFTDIQWIFLLRFLHKRWQWLLVNWAELRWTENSRLCHLLQTNCVPTPEFAQCGVQDNPSGPTLGVIECESK